MEHQGSPTREMDIRRWEDGSAVEMRDTVAQGSYVTFHIEPMEGLLDIVMTPLEYEEFLVGHLYSEGLVKGADALADLIVGQRGPDRVEVLVELDPEGLDTAEDLTVDTDTSGRGLIQREHGSPPAWYARPLSPIEGGLGVKARALVGVPGHIQDRTGLFEATGAFHYAFVVGRDGTLLHGASDIGRHTALDKALGKALLAGEDLGRCLLYTTGRVSSDAVRKCIRSRVPLLASRGAPIGSAVDLASGFRLGAVGFLRGDRFNVYAGEHHIDWD